VAKQPPEWYAPGELQRVRTNLGPLSPSESRRMSEVLGGEIGSERTEEEIQQKYVRLKEARRRHGEYTSVGGGTDRAVLRDRDEAYEAQRMAGIPSGSSGNPSGVWDSPDASSVSDGPGGGSSFQPRPTFWNRVRMNYIASAPEHGVMTRFGAFLSVFSWLTHSVETVNPRFLSSADSIYFGHVEDLVFSVRFLLGRNARHKASRIREPFFIKILDVLQNWDVEGIHRELTHLQRNPRGVRFREMVSLCKAIYRPMALLLELDNNSHIGRALKRLADLDIMALPKTSSEILRIREMYAKARGLLPVVLGQVKFRCYPLLMKHVSDIPLSYHDFFVFRRQEVFAFLGVDPAAVLRPPDGFSDEYFDGRVDSIDDPEKTKHAADEDEEAGDDEEEVEDTDSDDGDSGEFAPAEGVPPVAYMDVSIQKGIELLELMFPEAGWYRLHEYPDLLPYFMPLLSFPRGVELIAPRDPLHQVVVLLQILQQLFYGFRSVKFGLLRDAEGNAHPVSGRIDALLGSWHAFLDTIIGTHYLGQLLEYCRRVEKQYEFKLSEYGRKIISDLLWIKRDYLLPMLRFGVVKKGSLPLSANLPRLFEVTAELRDILSRIAIELQDSDKAESIENPDAAYSFEVENLVSKRLSEILTREGKPKTNRYLVYYALAILCVLDHFLNDDDSHYYADERVRLYRSDPDSADVPAYTIAPLETDRIIREADLDWQENLHRKQNTFLDPVTGLFNGSLLIGKIKTAIADFAASGETFCLLSLQLGYSDELDRPNESDMSIESVGSDEDLEVITDGDGRVERLGRTGRIIRESIREFSDLPLCSGETFHVILPSTPLNQSLKIVTRLILKLKEESDGVFFIGIAEYRQMWSVGKLLKVTARALVEARRLPPPSVSVYDPMHDSFVTPTLQRNG
jgi:GGDEF domain-containing protein